MTASAETIFTPDPNPEWHGIERHALGRHYQQLVAGLISFKMATYRVARDLSMWAWNSMEADQRAAWKQYAAAVLEKALSDPEFYWPKKCA